MTTYFALDTSVAAHILFGHAPEAAAWFDGATGDPDVVVFASRLLRTELTRLLRREGLPVDLRDEIVDHVHLVPIDDAVLASAEAIVPHVKTLDAIHLGTVIRTGLDATIVTHDALMQRAAAVVGYPTFDPLGD
ncbi:PIN domain-containing protein [Microbacterium aurum]